MKLKTLKPTTAGTRHQLNINKNVLSKTNRLLKKEIACFKQSKGRSKTHGKITSWHRGGGRKLLLRNVKVQKKDSVGVILAVQYDSSKNSFTNLTFDLAKKQFYHEPNINNLYPGMITFFKETAPELRLGLRTKIENIPLGSYICNISSKKEEKVRYIKAAGNFGQLIKIDQKSVFIKLPSSKILSISKDSYGTIGIVSNIKHNKTVLGKAGRNRFMGRRPTVRGIAMNPVDHPHGGRTNGGKPSVTPWGLPTKAGFTRKKKKKHD